MTIVAIANTLHEGQMRSRSHREPMIQASELLLQERMPQSVADGPPRGIRRASMWTTSRNQAPVRAPSSRLLRLASDNAFAVERPIHGHADRRRCRLQPWRDIAVTRWREDATRDNWGFFVFLRMWKADDLVCEHAADRRRCRIEPKYYLAKIMPNLSGVTVR